jgi:type IV pilus assembly protein PilV
MKSFLFASRQRSRASAVRRGGSGFSLIEVLVALIVLSLGVLGAASVQTSSLKLTQVGQQRSTATQLAADLTERMRANLAGVRAGDYAFALAYAAVPGATPGAVNCTSTCLPQQIADRDINLWQAQLSNVLPGGRGIIIGDGVNSFQVTVMWTEKDLGASLRAPCPTIAAAPAEVQCVSMGFQP